MAPVSTLFADTHAHAAILREEPLQGNVVRVGYGRSIAHHGELAQGKFEEHDGLHRALVTVPCELFHSEASIYFEAGSGDIEVEPKNKSKSRRAVELTLAVCGWNRRGARLVVSSDIPEGWGLGSSTSECVSSVRATANAHGVVLRPDVIARIVVAAETASDSIMYSNRAVLFEHRAGVILEDLGDKLPNFYVLGFNTDPAGVDTLELEPADYCRDEIEEFGELRGLLRRAVNDQSVDLIGVVASASARINERYLPKRNFSEFRQIAAEVRASGVQVAHSGTVIGFIFDPKLQGVSGRIRRARALLAESGVGETWCFEVGHEQREVKYL